MYHAAILTSPDENWRTAEAKRVARAKRAGNLFQTSLEEGKATIPR